MSKLGGLALILAGLGLLWQVLPSGSERTDPVQLIEVAKTPPPSRSQAALAPQAMVRAIERTDQATIAPKPLPTVQANTPSPSAPVIAMQRASGSTAAPATKPLPKRDSLALELQRELRRVGCYEGQLNGAWTTSTRSAMKAFIDRVNATLPVAEPDYILLALLQNHPDKACSEACPTGQELSNNGRCVPNAILAKKSAQPSRTATPQNAYQPVLPAPVITGWSTSTTAVTPLLPSVAAPIEGRMALAGPVANLKSADARRHGTKGVRRGHHRRLAPPLRYVQRRSFGWSRALFGPGRSMF